MPSTSTDDVKDGVSKEQITSVVTDHRGPIQNCYEQELHQRADLQGGGLVVGWEIDPAGKVSRSWIVEDTLGSRPAECIAQEICSWWFPAAKVTTRVARFPFLFRIRTPPPPTTGQ